MATQIEIPREFVVAPVSFAQQRLWLIDRLSPGSSAYNVRHAVRLRGPLDVVALQRSIDAIVDRHEILRTSFALVDGELMQFIAPTGTTALRFVDVSDLPHKDRESRAREIVSDEATHGFDLEKGPLVRALLVRSGPTEHVFLTVMHHILTDDWSTGVFNRELAAFYEGYSGGEIPELDELPIQYADFAAWQREWLQGDEFERQIGYWRERLAGAPGRIELPTDRPRSPHAGSDGASRSLIVSRAVLEQLHGFGNQHGATLFMTVLAAFNVLLYRYCGQTDLVVGLPISTRTRTELQDLIGFFVNTLALRTHVSGELSFTKLLQDVRDAALRAYEHQDVSFEQVVAELHPDRSVGETPLVNVLFHLQNKRGDTAARLPGTQAEPFPLGTTTAKFDIILRAAEMPDGLQCTISYRPDLFDGARIERMLSNFETLLESIVGTPEQSVATLPLLPDAERRKVLVEWNDTATDYPAERTLAQAFEAQAQRSPGAVALSDGANETTYLKLDRRANQLAHHLRGYGVGDGDVVGICLERSVDTVLATLAVLKAGAVYLPLDPEYPPDRLEYMLRDAGARVVLTREPFAPALGGTGAAVCCLDVDAAQIAQHPDDAPPRTSGPGDLAYIMYTSGSTGRPKGVCVPQRAVNRLVTNTNYVAITPSDVMAAVSNVAFDAATFELWGALLHGARIEIIARETLLSPKAFAETLRERRITVMFLTAALLRHVATEEPGAFAGLRCLIAGGDALDPSAVAAVLAHGRPRTFLNGYGPTESTTFACTYQIEHADSRTIPIGRPIANTQAYILDRDLQPVPIGVDGQLYIGGPGLACGYLNDSVLTAQKFIAHPFSTDPGARLYATGDVVRYRVDGTIEFVGRSDNQIKVRGFRVETGEIEAALRRHEAVRDAVVVARKNDDGDVRLIAYVVEGEDSPRTADDWRKLLAAELPPYMVPAVMVLQTLPLGPNGKLDYAALPHPHERPATPARSGEARLNNPLHYQLLAIWEDILGVPDVKIDDNFFALGGHSLLAARAIDALSHAYGKPFPPAEFFREPTVEHVARVFVDGMDQVTTSPVVAVQPHGSRPPFFFLNADLKGGGYYVRRLALGLHPDQPVYSVHPHGVNARPFPATIEAMASDYVAVIQSVRPHGPYALGGFCSGALVAFEMARQLTTRGETVSALILMDSSGNNGRLTAPAERIERVLCALRIGDVRRFGVRTALARAAHFVRRGRRYLRRVAATPERRLRTLLPGIAERTYSAVLAREPGDLEQRWRRVTRDYIPRRYRGRATVLLASADGKLRPSAAWTGWRFVTDSLAVAPLVGAHLTSITRHVDATARCLNEHLSVGLPLQDSVSPNDAVWPHETVSPRGSS
ncbi:MAG: amino acid adenylation domain-containing protein [Candidatus Eremiobacteraeota bacterium]|nr:amino acid adenylation domain-containing protein [Candidatus Eremiobacteraeota bacterium]MBC5802172.1 amino acid adenylation domain-containing protein [Candidatus Eremiobacteraeota bacterium]MBC5821273.1 amino acid adenylation domain-containing protein [Candidatus Eremiobacteraeota bacterium]